MRVHRPAAFLAVLAASALAGACGGGSTDEDEIRTVVNHLRDSDEAVCGEVTEAHLKELFKDKADCVREARASRETRIFEVRSLQVRGRRATVRVQSGKDRGAILFVKQRDRWKISDTGLTSGASR